MEKLLAFAKRVAYNMSSDPEMGSIAGIALHRAVSTYDDTRGVPLKRWIARQVKIGVWNYWRRVRDRHEEHQSEVWWGGVFVMDTPEIQELPIPAFDWKLLCEYYIEKWPLDVVARRYDTTVYGARKLLRQAEARLVEATRDKTSEAAS